MYFENKESEEQKPKGDKKHNSDCSLAVRLRRNRNTSVVAHTII